MTTIESIIRELNINQFHFTNDELLEIPSTLRKSNFDELLKERFITNQNINTNKKQNNRRFNFLKTEDLNSHFELIFGNEKINKFKIVENSRLHRNYVSSFIGSILTLLQEDFILYEINDKANIIKDLLNKISKDLLEKNYYKKFNYNRNRFFKRDIIQQTLNKAISFNIDMEYFYIIQQYIADYLGINIIIFKLNADKMIDFDQSVGILSKHINSRINRYLPYVTICLFDNMFFPILNMIDEEEKFLLHSKDNDIINNICNYMNIEDRFKIVEEELLKKSQIQNNETTITNTENENTENVLEEIDQLDTNKLKNMKIDELQQLVIKLNKDIKKKSEKTNKMISKTKDELIDSILFDN